MLDVADGIDLGHTHAVTPCVSRADLITENWHTEGDLSLLRQLAQLRNNWPSPNVKIGRITEVIRARHHRQGGVETAIKETNHADGQTCLGGSRSHFWRTRHDSNV